MWKLNHNLVSVKKTENKYDRDKNGNLVQPNCPMCNYPTETRDHYNDDCPHISAFCQNVAKSVGRADFKREEWNLEHKSDAELNTILIAKACWIFYCERCTVDHNRRKRTNQQVILKRTQQRTQLAITI